MENMLKIGEALKCTVSFAPKQVNEGKACKCARLGIRLIVVTLIGSVIGFPIYNYNVTLGAMKNMACSTNTVGSPDGVRAALAMFKERSIYPKITDEDIERVIQKCKELVGSIPNKH